MQHSPSEWLDLIWRTHRRALLPTEAVLSRASLGLTRLREAGLAHAATLESSSANADPLTILATRVMHDPNSMAAASTAVASLLSDASSSSAASAAVPALLHVPADIEIDSTGDSSSPIRLVETIQQLASHGASAGVAPSSTRRVLFASPADLPAMPLVVAAAWSHGLAAFSLPMLLQTREPSSQWQRALAASLHTDGSHPNSGMGSGRERWITQAAELTMQLAAERLYGSSGSADFHDVALMRCEARRSSPAPVAAPVAQSLAATAAASARALAFAPTVAQLRRFFHMSLLVGAQERQQPRPPATAGNIGGLNAQADDRSQIAESYSYTSSALLKCPATAFELVSIGQSGLSTGLNTQAAAAAAAVAAMAPGAALTSAAASASKSKSAPWRALMAKASSSGAGKAKTSGAASSAGVGKAKKKKG